MYEFLFVITISVPQLVEHRQIGACSHSYAFPCIFLYASTCIHINTYVYMYVCMHLCTYYLVEMKRGHSIQTNLAAYQFCIFYHFTYFVNFLVLLLLLLIALLYIFVKFICIHIVKLIIIYNLQLNPTMTYIYIYNMQVYLCVCFLYSRVHEFSKYVLIIL